jgi:hypothetical protein
MGKNNTGMLFVKIKISVAELHHFYAAPAPTPIQRDNIKNKKCKPVPVLKAVLRIRSRSVPDLFPPDPVNISESGSDPSPS